MCCCHECIPVHTLTALFNTHSLWQGPLSLVRSQERKGLVDCFCSLPHCIIPYSPCGPVSYLSSLSFGIYFRHKIQSGPFGLMSWLWFWPRLQLSLILPCVWLITPVISQLTDFSTPAAVPFIDQYTACQSSSSHAGFVTLDKHYGNFFFSNWLKVTNIFLLSGIAVKVSIMNIHFSNYALKYFIVWIACIE